MNVPEHTPIIEDGALPNTGEHREIAATVSETADPSTRVETLGRDDKSEGVETLGRDDKSEKPETGAPPDRGPRRAPLLRTSGWLSPVVGDRVGTDDEQNAGDTTTSKPVKLCLHVKEDGFFCGRPALTERLYCYQHLRLRGQQMRMARARAQSLACPLMLPALDDLNAVKVALTQVTHAVTAGQLEHRRAGLLLYALQQAASNLWHMELIQMNSARSPQQSQAASEAGEQKRLVEEYPGFEAEFGLPVGLDLTQPPEVLFPAAEHASATARATLDADPPPRKLWSKESIELEELDKQRANIGEKSYSQQASKVNDRMSKQAQAQIRKAKEAEWEAEAERRNAAEAEKGRQYRNMDEGQRRAYHLGVLRGLEAAQEQAEKEARARKPVASGDAGISANAVRSNSA